MRKILFSILLFSFVLQVFSQENSSKSEFKPSGKIWGYAFGDYYFKTHADALSRGNIQYSNMPVNSNAFDLRRIYLGYDYTISEKFTSELLLAHDGQTLSDNTRTVVVKSANVRWKNIFSRTDLVAGLHSTPSFPMLEEKIWGYRSVEKTILDMRKFASSTDLGISLQGKLDSAGSFGYNAMVANGSALKLEGDRFKRFYGDVYAKFANQRISVDLYCDYERIQLSPYHKSKMSLKLFLAYQTEKFTVGVDIFRQMQENHALYANTITNKIDTANVFVFGAGIFARGTILKDKFFFFVRADAYNPDSEFNKDYVYGGTYSAYDTELFLVSGLDYTPISNVHIIPNLWYNSYQSRMKNASGKMKSDYDLVPRITIHYIFR